MALAESPGFRFGENELPPQLGVEAIEPTQEDVEGHLHSSHAENAGRVGQAAVYGALQGTPEPNDTAPPDQELPQEVTPSPRRQKQKRRSSRQTSDQDPDEDSVHRYLKEMGRHPLLTKDDEVRLARDIEAGKIAAERLKKPSWHHLPHERSIYAHEVERGREAYATFVESNLRLVVSIAKRYQASGLPLLDLIQEGNFGLMQAVEKFDYRKGFKFSTYATWWIRQAIHRGAANTANIIRLPVHAGDRLRILRRARYKLEEQGRPESLAALMEETGLPKKYITELVGYLDATLSISQPIGNTNTDLEIGDLIPDVSGAPPDDEALATLLPEEIEVLLEGLDVREREILRQRFGLGGREEASLDAVGQQFSLTKERIRQIQEKAIVKLRGSADPGLLQN